MFSESKVPDQYLPVDRKRHDLDLCCATVEERKLLDIKEKIAARLDDLEEHLLAGEHLKSAEGVVAVLNLIAYIAKFTSVLTSAERDFINAAKMAVAERKEWK
jgi:hypothetical protein